MTAVLPRQDALANLRMRMSGHVASPTDPLYHELRLAWNRSFEHMPALTVVPRSTADVAEAVRFAMTRGMKVGVQATGHGVARTADGAMLVLTNELDDVTVDGDAWTATIGAGARWEKVLGPAGAVGLAPLLGSTPDVSATGYTLGGGIGWLARMFGLAADHVRMIEIVTADGQIKRASPDSEPDLFWALRGGGAGSMGVVTSLEVDLFPVSSVYAGNLLYPASLAREVAVRYRDWLSTVPDALTSSITFMNFPLVDGVPEVIRGKSFAIVRGAFVGSDKDGEALLRQFRDWRTPELDMWGRIPFTEIATVSNDPVDPTPGMATTEWFATLPDEVIDIVVEALFEHDGPSPLTLAEFRHAGGAVSRLPEHPNAYRGRSYQHLLELVGGTPTKRSHADLRTFVDEVKSKLARYRADGVYLNFLAGDEKVARTREAFDADTWERMRAIKATVDPSNMFDRGIAIQ